MANEFENLGFVPEEEFKKLGFEEEKPVSENIEDKVKSFLSSAAETGKGVINDWANVGQGIVSSIPFAEEMQAGGQSLLDILSGEGNIEDYSKIYPERLKQFQQINEQSSQESPIAHGLGTVLGVGGQILGTGGTSLAPKAVGAVSQSAKALQYLKEAAKGAGLGATYGAGEAKDTVFTDPKAVAKEALSGAMVGGGIGVAGRAISDVAGMTGDYLKQGFDKFAEESPLTRQAFIRPFQEGMKGTPFTKESWVTDKGIHIASESAQDMFNKIQDARKLLGSEVTKTLTDATEAGKVIDLGKAINESSPELLKYLKINPALLDNKNVNSIVERITSGKTQITPLEAKELRDQLYSVSDKLSSGTGVEKSIGGFADKFAAQIRDVMGTEVPSFKVANDRYKNFMDKVPETIMRGDMPNIPGLKKASEMGNYEQSLTESLMNMFEGATSPGKVGDVGKSSYSNLMKNLKELEGSEASRIASGDKAPEFLSKLGKSEDIKSNIRDTSDMINMIGRSRAVDPNAGVKSTMKSLLHSGGAGSSGASLVTSAGKHVGEATGVLTRTLYQKPNDALLRMAQNMKGTGLEHFGNNLERAITNKNEFLKNAAIFTMLQSPDARNYLNQTEQPDEE